MVITVGLANFSVKRTLIDQGSSTNILYYSNFQKLGIPKSTIKQHNDKLIGFAGEQVDTRGYVDLLTSFGDEKLSETISEVRDCECSCRTS